MENKVSILSDEDFINIIDSSKSWKEICVKIGYNVNSISNRVRKLVRDRCLSLNIEFHFNDKRNDTIINKTKHQLFNYRKNWQSARTAIQKHARSVYFDNNPNPKCFICGYSNHIEVAHIKSVSDFEDSSTIKEINSIDNLIGLCPNHHWEFDNGLLKL